jgi:ubiquinone/menaquinone biosynthesis C-methylase UbiE
MNVGREQDMAGKLKHRIASLLRPRGKLSFARSLPNGSAVLDVGCGNQAVVGIKNVKPTCSYTGIDIGDYNQTEHSKQLMDEYVIVDVDQFAMKLASFGPRFDAVISSHNLEHCDKPEATLAAIVASLKPGGKVYLAFPCAESVSFPSRLGTLNYYDDHTHKGEPPNFGGILRELQAREFKIEYATSRYKPMLLRLVGLALEPVSAFRKKVMKGTWEFHGFESIIIATKM